MIKLIAIAVIIISTVVILRLIAKKRVLVKIDPNTYRILLAIGNLVMNAPRPTTTVEVKVNDEVKDEAEDDIDLDDVRELGRGQTFGHAL